MNTILFINFLPVFGVLVLLILGFCIINGWLNIVQYRKINGHGSKELNTRLFIYIFLFIMAYVGSGFFAWHFLEDTQYFYTKKMMTPDKQVVSELNLFRAATNEISENLDYFYNEARNIERDTTRECYYITSKRMENFKKCKNDCINLNKLWEEIENLGSISICKYKSYSITYRIKIMKSPRELAIAGYTPYVKHELRYYKEKKQKNYAEDLDIWLDENFRYCIRKERDYYW